VSTSAHVTQVSPKTEDETLEQETSGRTEVERIRRILEERGMDPCSAYWDELGYVATNLSWQELVEGQLDGIHFRGALSLIGTRGIRDLSGVNGTRLFSIDISESDITRLPNLRGGIIADVVAINSDLESLDGLQGSEIEILDIGGTRVYDLAPLADCRVSELGMTDTSIGDLTPLRNMTNLYYVAAARTKITDLSPLAGARLRFLDVSQTQVTSIEDLNVSWLEEVSVWKTLVTNINCLAGSPVHKLSIDVEEVANAIPVMTQMTNLCWVNSIKIRDVRAKMPASPEIRAVLTTADALTGPVTSN